MLYYLKVWRDLLCVLLCCHKDILYVKVVGGRQGPLCGVVWILVYLSRMEFELIIN